MCRLRDRPLPHNPANWADFARSQELPGSTRLRGGGHSRSRTRLSIQPYSRRRRRRALFYVDERPDGNMVRLVAENSHEASPHSRQ